MYVLVAELADWSWAFTLAGKDKALRVTDTTRLLRQAHATTVYMVLFMYV
jgi:hypothetical protein